ncbi:MAG TPA: hypothetical protein V6C63_02045 [Allocoleopsis sp.]
MPSLPYRRSRGFQPSYTPDQTRHYKSQNVRYQKALNLKPVVAGNSYRFSSPRSPVGYWEVRPGDELQTSHMRVTCVYSVAVSDTGAISPRRITQSATFDVQFFDGSFQPIVTAFRFSPDYSHWQFDDRGYRVDAHALRFVDLGIATFALVTRLSDFSNKTVSISDIPLFRPLSRFESNFSNIETNLRSTLQPFSSSTCDSPSGCMNGEAFGAEMTYTIVPLDGMAGVSADFVCTCPDFTKQQAALRDSPYVSEQVDRDWSASGAGTDSDCKHIIATKLYRRDNVQPSDREPLRESSVPDWLRQENEELRRIRRQWRQEDRAEERDRRRRIRQDREADLSY